MVIVSDQRLGGPGMAGPALPLANARTPPPSDANCNGPPAGRAGPYHTRPTANAGTPQYPWGDANSLSIILWCRSASGVRTPVRSARDNSSVHPPGLFRTLSAD